MPLNLGQRSQAQTIFQRLPATKFYYGWVIITVAFLSSYTWTATFNPILGVFMKPLGQDFGWSRTTISWASSAASLAGGFLGPLIGPVLDKRGPRLVLIISSLVAGICLIALAQLSALWQFYLLYGIVRLTTVAGSQLAISVAVANWFVRKRGRASGLAALGQRVGMISLPPLAQYIIVAFGWRSAWVVLGIIVIATGAIPSALFMRRRPEDFGLHPDGLKPQETAEDINPVGSAPVTVQVGESWTRQEALRTRAFWLLAMAVAQGIRTARGGATSHAAVVARQIGKPRPSPPACSRTSRERKNRSKSRPCSSSG